MKRIFKALKKGWMAFAHTLGLINTTILLTIFYFVLVGIYAVLTGIPKRIISLLSKQPTTYYKNHIHNDDLTRYKYPF